jgi:hypothetical protein
MLYYNELSGSLVLFSSLARWLRMMKILIKMPNLFPCSSCHVRVANHVLYQSVRYPNYFSKNLCMDMAGFLCIKNSTAEVAHKIKQPAVISSFILAKIQ